MRAPIENTHAQRAIGIVIVIVAVGAVALNFVHQPKTAGPLKAIALDLGSPENKNGDAMDRLEEENDLATSTETATVTNDAEKKRVKDWDDRIRAYIKYFTDGSNYLDIYKRLALTAEEQQELSSLLVSRELLMDAQLMGSPLSKNIINVTIRIPDGIGPTVVPTYAGDRSAQEAAKKQARQPYNTKILALLGPERFSALEDAERKLFFHSSVDELNFHLPADQQLNKYQEEMLISSVSNGKDIAIDPLIMIDSTVLMEAQSYLSATQYQALAHVALVDNEEASEIRKGVAAWTAAGRHGNSWNTLDGDFSSKLGGEVSNSKDPFVK